MDADTPAADPELLAAARAVQAHSYSPYSRFRVGAAIRTSSGAIHAGCNIENAAYPQSLCAEGAAIGVMVSAGDLEIVEVAVVTDGDEISTCCGGCRQRLREFAALDVPIHFALAEGPVRRTMTLGELLPESFGPENLAALGENHGGAGDV